MIYKLFECSLCKLVTMYQNLGAAEFYAVELDSASELVVSVSRLWLLTLSHFCRARYLALF